VAFSSTIRFWLCERAINVTSDTPESDATHSDSRLAAVTEGEERRRFEH